MAYIFDCILYDSMYGIYCILSTYSIILTHTSIRVLLYTIIYTHTSPFTFSTPIYTPYIPYPQIFDRNLNKLYSLKNHVSSTRSIADFSEHGVLYTQQNILHRITVIFKYILHILNTKVIGK